MAHPVVVDDELFSVAFTVFAFTTKNSELTVFHTDMFIKTKHYSIQEHSVGIVSCMTAVHSRLAIQTQSYGERNHMKLRQNMFLQPRSGMLLLAQTVFFSIKFAKKFSKCLLNSLK